MQSLVSLVIKSKLIHPVGEWQFWSYEHHISCFIVPEKDEGWRYMCEI